MIIEFDTKTNTLLLVPESRQEKRSLQVLYERMVWYAEDSCHDADLLCLTSGGILEINHVLPSY